MQALPGYIHHNSYSNLARRLQASMLPPSITSTYYYVICLLLTLNTWIITYICVCICIWQHLYFQLTGFNICRFSRQVFFLQRQLCMRDNVWLCHHLYYYILVDSAWTIYTVLGSAKVACCTLYWWRLFLILVNILMYYINICVFNQLLLHLIT